MAHLPGATSETSREFTYAQHSDNPNVGGGNGSLKNPYAYATNYLNQTANKTKKELNGMLGNFEWYGKWAAAQGVVRGVDLLSQSAGTAHTLSQNLSIKQIIYPVVATSVGRTVTGNWPKVQKAFDFANVASSAFAVYKKCDSLQPEHPTGIVEALSKAGTQFADNYPLIAENPISQAIIQSSVGQKIPGAISSFYTKFDSLKYGRATMFMAASWVGSHLLQKTPLIKHIANHPLANNILWGMRLGSTAYLASPLVATARAWNNAIVQKRLAEKAAPKKANKATAPTPPTQTELDQNLLTFKNKAEALEIIDGDKMCLPASAVQAFAGMGLERSQFTQPSEGPLLNDILEMTEKYTAHLVEKSRQARLVYEDACQEVPRLAPKSGVAQTPQGTEDFLAAMKNKDSTSVAWDEAEIAIISNNSQMFSSENKTKFATDLSDINTCMLRSKIYGRFVELLNDNSGGSHQKMALFSREFSNHQELLKDTLLSIIAHGLVGHAYVSMRMRIEDLIAGAPSAPIDAAEKCDWLARACDLSDNNLKASQIAWDKIVKDTNGAALPAPGALPIHQRIAQEEAAQEKAQKALALRSAKDSTLIERIEDSEREDTEDSYRAVFVEIDENNQALIGQSLSGSDGTWNSRKLMRGPEIESEVRTELAYAPDGEAISYIDDGSEERLYAKLPSRFVQDLGLKDPAKLHSGEELIAERDGYSEKLVYKCPSDQYKVGTNSDHELTAAVLLAEGLKVQSELMTKFAAGTLFSEPLEEIEGMIGFLDLCQNHRVTRLTSGNVPSFLNDDAWQNHWAGYSLDRDAIVTQLAGHYAIQQTQARVKAKLRNGLEFVEPRVGIAQMQEGVLLNAMKRLEELVNRTPSPVDCKTNGTTMSRIAFRKDFTDLKTAVTQALLGINRKVPNLFAACQGLVPDTRRPKLPNGSFRRIPVLKMLYEASGSMRNALENPNVEPVIRATLKDVTSDELKTELNECFAEIDKAYKDYVDYAGYNADLLAGSDACNFALASGKHAEIDARQYYHLNYFESPEIPSAVSHAWNNVKSKVNSGTQAAQSGVRAGAGMLAGGATAGATLALAGATAGATVAVAGASAMFGAGLRMVSSAVGHAPVSIAGPAPSAPDETLPPPYAPSSNYISLPVSTPAAGTVAKKAKPSLSVATGSPPSLPSGSVAKIYARQKASNRSLSVSPVGRLLQSPSPMAIVWKAGPVNTSLSKTPFYPADQENGAGVRDPAVLRTVQGTQYHIDEERWELKEVPPPPPLRKKPLSPQVQVAKIPLPEAPLLAPGQSYDGTPPTLFPRNMTSEITAGQVIVAQPVSPQQSPRLDPMVTLNSALPLTPLPQAKLVSPQQSPRGFAQVDLVETPLLPKVVGKSSLQGGATPPASDDDLPAWR